MKKAILALVLLPGLVSAQDFIRYYPPASAAGMLDPGSDGIMVRTATDTSAARSLTSPLGTLAIGNADGVAANPTLDVDTSIIGQFSSGAGTAPATCVQGDFYLETDTGFVTACPSTDAPNTLIGKAETSTSGFGFVIDEDSFATDSATKVPTQQSVKAYVDANAGDSGPTVILKVTDETIQEDTTLSDDAVLKFSAAANTKYLIRLSVAYIAPATGDFKFSVNCPASPTFGLGTKWTYVGASTTMAAGQLSCTTGSTALAGGAGTGGVVIDFVLSNGANVGNFVFQWAQNASEAADTTVRAGSFITYQVVP